MQPSDRSATDEPAEVREKSALERRTQRATRSIAAWTRPISRWLGRARSWLGRPPNGRRAAWGALVTLLVAGLLLPPISLVDRLLTPGYHRVQPSAGALLVPSSGDDAGRANVTFRRSDILRNTRMRLRALDDLPLGVAEPPPDSEPISPYYRLEFRGPVPARGFLNVVLPIQDGEQAMVDPFAWDGERWRWLPVEFTRSDQARVTLPFEQLVPDGVLLTRATGGVPEVSAVLEPFPATLPAAAAELPILEIRAYRLEGGDGSVERRPFPPVSRTATLWGVVDNLEGQRVRSDLVHNMLRDPRSRRHHRTEIVARATSDGLDGVLLDYREVPEDLHATMVELVALLTQDLAAVDIDLAVTVPSPRWLSDDEFDGGTVPWTDLGRTGAGVRLRLPADRPVSLDALDGMVRWALGRVDRRRLQISVPVHGVDRVGDVSTPIGYAEALGRVLDMARSDAPRRISPGARSMVELPTISASELGRDPETGMWRFYWWDANRRQHTVWLNDAEGLAPAFRIGREYHLDRLVLDGVSAGLDPFVWRMVRGFLEEGEVIVPEASYRLQWQLLDAAGRVVQEAEQPLEEDAFGFSAPEQGTYRLQVNLLTSGGDLAALGQPAAVRVAPPPRPTPSPTAIIFTLEPTPESYETAVPPADERIRRTPVRVAGGSPRATLSIEAYDAVFDAVRAPLRDAPDTSGEPLTDLRPGDRLVLLERSEDGLWWRVRMAATGLEGWVAADLLEMRTDATPSRDDEPTDAVDPASSVTTTPSRAGDGDDAGPPGPSGPSPAATASSTGRSP